MVSSMPGINELVSRTVDPRIDVDSNSSLGQASTTPRSGMRVNEYARRQKLRAQKLLGKDRWPSGGGHKFTYVLLLLYTFFVFFRPYELIPGAGFLSSITYFIAVATLVVFVFTQLSTTGSLSVFVMEIKAVLALTVLAVLTLPFARGPGLAWETFSDAFIKAVLIFIVLTNVIQTRRQLMLIIGVSLTMGFYVSCLALNLYMKGEFDADGYRVAVDLKGLFGNPNDMALHLSTMVPLALALGAGAKNWFAKSGYYSLTILMMIAVTVTFSRGGFLGLAVSLLVVAWKLSRRGRLKVLAGAAFATFLFTLLVPGSYGTRLLSMFIPGLDPTGSATARRGVLITSILVTLRNPWGVGIGNSPLFGAHDHETHNAYTQVSSELGILGLVAYLIFLVWPIRMLRIIERNTLLENEDSWIYYMSIGVQGALIAFMVSSFFASVAYNWYAYYLVAYGVCLRGIYWSEFNLTSNIRDTKYDRDEMIATGVI
jgi:O-antigen ligase